jgi:hypothetical protein
MMNQAKWKRILYYFVKPVIPRFLQIAVRRKQAAQTARGVKNTWPIDWSSGIKPEGWRGWPDDRDFAFVVTHDVESERGLRRCLRLARAERDLGFVSSFNFVPEKYFLLPEIRNELTTTRFEVGVHDLRHDGRLFSSEKTFLQHVPIINSYLALWKAAGFRAGSMYHNLEWMHNIRIEYDSSTFDTDPFEPQPDGVKTVFPIWIGNQSGDAGYVELPYTLPQDMTLFVLLQHRDINLWKEKLEWITGVGGMALFISHPDYMNWNGERKLSDEYPFEFYREFLDYVKRKYRGRYWNAIPRDVARYWRDFIVRSR